VCSRRDEGQLHAAFCAGGRKWIFPLLGTHRATAGSCLLVWAVRTRERSAKWPVSGGGHRDSHGAGARRAGGEAVEAEWVWREEEEAEGEDLAVVLPCQKEGLEKAEEDSSRRCTVTGQAAAVMCYSKEKF